MLRQEQSADLTLCWQWEIARIEFKQAGDRSFARHRAGALCLVCSDALEAQRGAGSTQGKVIGPQGWPGGPAQSCKASFGISENSIFSPRDREHQCSRYISVSGGKRTRNERTACPLGWHPAPPSESAWTQPTKLYLIFSSLRLISTSLSPPANPANLTPFSLLYFKLVCQKPWIKSFFNFSLLELTHPLELHYNSSGQRLKQWLSKYYANHARWGFWIGKLQKRYLNEYLQRLRCSRDLECYQQPVPCA